MWDCILLMVCRFSLGILIKDSDLLFCNDAGGDVTISGEVTAGVRNQL